VTYHVEPAESVSLPDGSADLVLAAQSLHWFDRDRFYAEAKRVLRPGGVLAAIGYNWMYVDPEVDQAISTRVLPLLEPYWAPHNAILWDGYRSIDFPGQEVRLGVFGIYLDWSFEQVEDYIRNWSACRALVRDPEMAARARRRGRAAPGWRQGRRHRLRPRRLHHHPG